MEHENDGDTNCNCRVRHGQQRISTGTGGLGNKRTSGHHLNSSIVDINLNTEKNPGGLKRFSSGKSSANTGLKNSLMSKIIKPYVHELYQGIC